MKSFLNTSVAFLAAAALSAEGVDRGAAAVDLFNFHSVDDLPDNLKKGLVTEKANTAQGWLVIFEKAKEAGVGPLTLSQAAAVAHRLGLPVPARATIRTYVSELIAQGVVVRPSRQTYVLAAGYEGELFDGAEDEEPAVAPAAAAPAADPLADEVDPLA